VRTVFDVYSRVRAFASEKKATERTANRLAGECLSALDREDLEVLALGMVKELIQAVARSRSRKAESVSAKRRGTDKPRYRSKAEEARETWSNHGYPWNRFDREMSYKCGCDLCLSGLKEYGELEAKLDREFSEGLQKAVKAFSDAVRLEVTRELLETQFALGDGQVVTWGEATIEQHQQRADLLEKMAIGTAETSARHLAAIRMLSDAGVQKLELLPEALAA